MKTKKNSIKTLAQLIDEQYGEKGTPEREEFEKGFQNFKLEAMVQDTDLEKL
jgi:HTH-type transcriptional regulator / antitoxin HipB